MSTTQTHTFHVTTHAAIQLPAVGSKLRQVYDYLRDGRALTPVEAQTNFSTMRLAAHIFELKARGLMHVTTTIKKNDATGTEYASYTESTYQEVLASARKAAEANREAVAA